MHTEGGEVARGVEGQLPREYVVTRLGVSEEALGAGRDPLERTAEMACRPRQGGVFGIGLDLRAEAATDVGRHAAHARGGDAEDAGEVEGHGVDALQ